MLSLFSSNYDYYAFKALHRAVIAAQLELSCTAVNCKECPHSEPCADLFRLERYIARKMKKVEGIPNE